MQPVSIHVFNHNLPSPSRPGRRTRSRARKLSASCTGTWLGVTGLRISSLLLCQGSGTLLYGAEGQRVSGVPGPGTWPRSRARCSPPRISASRLRTENTSPFSLEHLPIQNCVSMEVFIPVTIRIVHFFFFLNPQGNTSSLCPKNKHRSRSQKKKNKPHEHFVCSTFS